MKRINIVSWVRLLSVILTAAVLLSGSALADLKRGSTGDAVKAMQEQLIDVGALNDLADGIFGRKTEKAVKDLQKYWGMKQNGRADEDFLQELNLLWYAATGNATESGADPEDMPDIPRYCSWNESLELGASYCWRHEEVAFIRYFEIYNENMPEGVEKVILNRIIELCLEQNGFLYDEWENAAPIESQDLVAEQREIFEEGFQEMCADMDSAYGADSLEALREKAGWLDRHMVDLCFDLYGAESNEQETQE